jgi:hypothetical protein
MHYGIACCPIYDETTHKSAQKYWDSWEGVWRCKTINWLIKKVRSFIPNSSLLWNILVDELTMSDREMIYGNQKDFPCRAINNVGHTLRVMNSS